MDHQANRVNWHQATMRLRTSNHSHFHSMLQQRVPRDASVLAEILVRATGTTAASSAAA